MPLPPPRRPRLESDTGALVTFRFRPPRLVQGVDLRGDMVHWQYPLEMAPDGSSSALSASLRLEPGTYGYKFRMAGGEWLLDPRNPRTRGVDGIQNSLLVVGGAEEPVLHAPCRPFVFVEDDGRLRMRAGLRRGAAQPLFIRWTEGHGTQLDQMSVVASEDDHLLLETTLPGSSGFLEYVFQTGDGSLVGQPGGAAQAFGIDLDAVRPMAPAWWRDAVLYTIFVDRFRSQASGGAWPQEISGLSRGARAGGDLAGIVNALPYLADLGVTALHLTPVVHAPSAHRYDTVDPRTVDRALGGQDVLAHLLNRAQDLDLRVLLDISLTHVHRSFFAFRDVCAKGPQSAFWDWFIIHHHPFGEGPHPGYEHYQKGQWEEPLLQTAHPEVADYLVATFEHWARLGVDGFRIDAAADVPLGLLERVARAVKGIRPEAALFAEVTTDNIHRFTACAVDAATDFASQQVLYDWLWRRTAQATRVAQVLSRRRFWRGGPGWSSISFTATHDQPRLRSLLKDPAPTRVGHLLSLLRSDVPSVYYGDEIGLSSEDPDRDFEDAWPDRLPMPWDQASWDTDTLNLFRRALRLRKESLALRRGDEEVISLSSEDGDDVLLIRRTYGLEVVDVILHGGPEIRSVALPLGAGRGVESLLELGAVTVDSSSCTVTLGPWSAWVARRVPDGESEALWRPVTEQARQLSHQAFRAGLVEAVAPPVHFYLTVTEGCNLRCRHCLNHSPRWTEIGRARHLQPWLIERLREGFACADYFGFSHGGESLTSPRFFDVLHSIQQARGSRPGRYDIHLLTNGMLLTDSITRRLVDLGVTSLAVSLDGARATTNDRIRLGGSFERVVAHIRKAVQYRANSQADLRIGISTVVTQSNLTELPALAELAENLGVDWLKIEEMVPVNGFARSETVNTGDPHLREIVEQVRDACGKSRVVLVDHLDAPSGCDCEAKTRPALAAFRRADNFANRVEFHPCRMEWEQACIDPDGTVRAVDYHHPVLGNLLRADLMTIWDGPRARRLREAALTRIPKGMREGCGGE